MQSFLEIVLLNNHQHQKTDPINIHLYYTGLINKFRQYRYKACKSSSCISFCHKYLHVTTTNEYKFLKIFLSSISQTIPLSDINQSTGSHTIPGITKIESFRHRTVYISLPSPREFEEWSHDWMNKPQEFNVRLIHGEA